ncbi:MAG: hypothetical protein JWN01_113 [Patescibacteria group bacterium]|nr:hypothetical protein [Patescibacteria group bacterium]
MSVTAQVEQICERAIRERVFPGCTVGWIRRGKTEVRAFGRLTYEAGAPAVTAETTYDVASITKSIPTSSIILKLLEDGRVALDDQAIAYVPELQNEFRERILIRHLLTYTVIFDLPGGLAKVARETPDQLLERLFTCPLLAPPGERYHYTNSPAILLGLIVERICGRPLDEVAQELFFKPLGMKNTTFHPGLPAEAVAPTEVDWRGEVRGSVHDEAGWALRESGKPPGHAGLFSTTGDVLKFE